MRHQGMPAFVEREDAPLLLCQHLALLQAGDDALERPVEVGLRNSQVTTATGLDRRLVADVRELGSGQPGGLPSDDAQIDVVEVERLAARVHAENGLTAG